MPGHKKKQKKWVERIKLADKVTDRVDDLELGDKFFLDLLALQGNDWEDGE